MLPFWLELAVAVVAPFPSKVWVPTSTNGPANSGGAAMDPVDVYAKVPCRLAVEHPLSSALAAGAMHRVSAATAAIVKVFAIVLLFIKRISFSVDVPAGSIRLTTNKETRGSRLQPPRRKSIKWWL